jgi:hypothetical protein
MIDPYDEKLDEADLAEIEIRIAAVLGAAAGTTPRESALALAAALYAVIWSDVRANAVPEQEERPAIAALLEAAVTTGAEYARAMIAEGQFRVVAAP